jgi:hypothetical protein
LKMCSPLVPAHEFGASKNVSAAFNALTYVKTRVQTINDHGKALEHEHFPLCAVRIYVWKTTAR